MMYIIHSLSTKSPVLRGLNPKKLDAFALLALAIRPLPLVVPLTFFPTIQQLWVQLHLQWVFPFTELGSLCGSSEAFLVVSQGAVIVLPDLLHDLGDLRCGGLRLPARLLLGLARNGSQN